MEMNFCRRCGTPLRNTEGHVYMCENDHIIFANASPTAGLWLVNEKNEVLVAVRARNPGLGLLDAPGGFCDGAEIFEDTITRELEEEVGLKPSDYTIPKYLLSALDTYEYKNEMIDALSNMYYARIIGNPVIKPQDDVAEAHWIPIEDVSPDQLYFNAVREGFLKLKSILATSSS
jgi:ADP-ribose pyrophosphatase YjhB (NUDIX family)